MTQIAWQGGPVFRSGAVGTGQGCCCGKCYSQYGLCNGCSYRMNDAYNFCCRAQGGFPLVPSIGVFTADTGTCKRIKAEGSAILSGGCTFGWYAYYRLECTQIDATNNCVSGCSLVLDEGPFLVPQSANCNSYDLAAITQNWAPVIVCP